MKLINEQKNIEIIMESYEFPYDKDGQIEDNNWINVKVIWEDEVIKQEGITPCLLTWELTDLIQSLSDYCVSKTSSYASEFLEPNLVVRVQPLEEDIAFYMSFLFPNHNEPFIFVKRMKKEELLSFIDDLKKQSKNFPKR